MNGWRKWPAWLLPCLALTCLAAQVAPFVVYHVPGPSAIAATSIPAWHPGGYDAADLARAHAFSRALLFGGMARSATWILAMLSLVACGVAAGFADSSKGRGQAWLVRVLLLVGLFLFLQLVELPYLVCRFFHFQAFGLTALTLAGWTKLMLVGSIVPLALFVLKYLLVVCSLPLFKRFWWIGACLCIFVLFEVVPEVASRRYPLDPVESLTPMGPGPHADSMKAVIDRAGLDLPLMVVDLGERVNTANIYIAGRHGREYVVVTDTFLRQFTPEEVTLALGHELAHVRNRFTLLAIHKTLSFLTLASGFFLAFMLTGRSALRISAAPRVVLVLMLSLALTSLVMQPLANSFYREQELQSDIRAVELAGDPAAYGRLLLKMAKLNLEPLDMPWWEKIFFSSYPSTMDRLAALKRRAG